MIPIIAHRGNHDTCEAPENTEQAFNAAVNLAIDGIELDIQKTKDNQVVVFHDTTTKRLSNSNLTISSSTYSQLKKISLNTNSSNPRQSFHIATLGDVLNRLSKKSLIFCEIKSNHSIVPPLKALVKDLNVSPNQLIFIGFSHRPMTQVKQALPSFKTYLLYKNPPTFEQIQTDAHRCNMDGISIQFSSLLKPNFISAVQAMNLSIHSYLTPKYENDVWAHKIESLCKFGLSSITTNRPLWIKKILTNG